MTRRMQRWHSRASRLTLRVVEAGLVLAPTLVLAAEDGAEHHGNPWLDLLWKAVNFAALAVLLWYFLRKPVANSLRAAASRVKTTVDEARASAAAMDRRYQDQRRNLENLKTELESLRADARAETAAESERLKKDAQASADHMTGQIEKQVQQARNRALQSLRAELADEAVKLAENLIKQKLDDATQRRLLDEQIAAQERVS